MKIFVTGGSGFVGGAAIQALGQDHEVLAMSRREDSDTLIRGLGGAPVRCSLSDVKASDLEACDAVVHSAARVEAWGSREQFWSANVSGTERLLAAAKEAGVKRFVHISSEAVLFNGQDLIGVDESHPYPQKTPFLYSETKRAAEQRVITAASDNFETIILRPRMIWGPGDKTVIPEVKAMVEKGQFRWIGGGRYQTETTHIDNLSHAIKLALKQGESKQCYFIIDEGAVEMKHFMSSLLKTAGVDIPDKSISKGFIRAMAVVVEGCWNFFGIQSAPPVGKFPANIMSAEFTVNSDKAERGLAYQPVISREQGLKELADM